jgi:hypothetical protein
MSPAMAAARKAGPPIAAGRASVESSGAFIAALFALDGAGGAGVARAGTEPVESATFGKPDCGAGDAAGETTLGGGSEATSGVAGAAAGSEICAVLGFAGVASSAAVGAGAASGTGSPAAASDALSLPAGSSDPLRGCAALLSG